MASDEKETANNVVDNYLDSAGFGFARRLRSQQPALFALRSGACSVGG